MTEERKLAEIVARIIDACGPAIRISPTWVAAEAMKVLDPDGYAPMLVHAGCNLQMRQIARSVLRKQYEPDEGSSDQHELYPDLQRRYPTARSAKAAEPEYVLLEHLTDIDIAFNVARLEAEAGAKRAHADALRAYGRDRPKPEAVA